MIYLLEDEESIRKLVIYALENQGYQARGFETSPEFREAMKQELPDLVLLDIMLPGEDGISILKSIRNNPATRQLPVIMLTAKNTEYDRVEGLDAGADDFISKPFGMMEMVARVRAVLRRSSDKPSRQDYQAGILFVSPERHEVRVNGKPVTLTFKEFLLLELFLEHRDLVLTRQILLDKIWGHGIERENRTLDVHIHSLRAKLGPAGNYIQTIRGIGYLFSEEEKE